MRFANIIDEESKRRIEESMPCEVSFCSFKAMHGYDRCAEHLGWTGRMPVVCSLCKRDLGTKPCAPDFDGMVSHGFCVGCAESWFKNR